jgi:hypothetical protein
MQIEGNNSRTSPELSHSKDRATGGDGNEIVPGFVDHFPREQVDHATFAVYEVAFFDDPGSAFGCEGV